MIRGTNSLELVVMRCHMECLWLFIWNVTDGCFGSMNFRMVWFEAATVVPMAPPVDIPAGSVLKSALAGGMASALSTSMLHPLDTVKVRRLCKKWSCCSWDLCIVILLRYGTLT